MPSPTVLGKVVRGLPENLDAVRARRESLHEAMIVARALPPVDDGRVAVERLRWAVSHAGPALTVARLVAGLPRVTISLGHTSGGRAIRRQIVAHCGGFRPWQMLARSVYVIPADGRPFPGRAHHSRRSAVNQARRAGVTTRVLTAAEALDDPSVLQFGPCPLAPGCNGRSYAAYHPDGHAIAVHHVHVDGDVAELAQGMVKDGEPLTDQARYAVFTALVEDLAASEVRLLVVLASWLFSDAGVRRLQSLLGFLPAQLNVSARPQRP